MSARNRALNDGHGPLLRLPDYVNNGFILGQKEVMDRERRECEAAVAVALRDGVTSAGGHGKPWEEPDADALDALATASDDMLSHLDKRRRTRLVEGSKLNRLRKPNPTRGGAGVPLRGNARGAGARAA